jgi:two-component system OmpR family sensor kinase
VVSAISGVVLVLVGWWVIRLGVRPLKSMATAASAIAAGDLSSRVPAGNPRTEAGELGLALNTMLARIETAFDARAESQARLQRFVADASHELRTPVATIRGYAELYRQGGLATEHALADAMRRTEQEAKRMGLLVDDMLLLAKLDERRPLAHEAVDIAALAMDAVSDAQAVDPSRAIVARVQPGVVVDGDVDRLRQVIANLIANALVHTPAGSPIEVCASHTAGDVEIAIVDHGPGIPAHLGDRAFERFVRADESRSRARGGSGLGLAIVAGIVTAHEGSVQLRETDGGGATVVVSLPAHAAAMR